jgi:hypothetical protein
MKLVTFADTPLLIGNEAADLLLRYAASLANVGRADVVVLKALGAQGENVDVTFLLDAGAVMLSKQSDSQLPEPDNSTAVGYMRDRMHSLEQPLRVHHGEALFDDVSRSLLD